MSATEQAAAPQPGRVPAARGGKLALLALAMTLVVAVSGYYWTRFVAEPGTAALRAQLEDVGVERTQLAARLSASDERMQKLEAAQSAALTTIDELRAHTAALDQSLKALATRSSDKTLDWILAECEYLILAASQRLALQQDAATASAALSAADDRLRRAEHPATAPLREQLAHDIQALNAVPLVDIEGLSLKFAAQIRKADKLKTKPIAEVDTSFKHSREQRVTANNWRDVLQAMWDDLKSLVEIKDDALPDGVLFDPKLRYFVEQNLKLELSSARLAILERDTTNFRVAVEIVQDAVARYYDADDAAVKALAAMLTEARGIELAPPLPNVTASLDAVRAARQALAAPAPTPSAPTLPESPAAP